ncbi:hypothetical protein [Brevibacterium spongiae]|uniref:Ketopantoate reductase N-terminal domain-containing protein n=1 Tax=Brevibacterium spongiae TaxID=2909672 RepID=A0ABY5SNM9_9MICO|nr:hypothetical protein [Brevibacterium spongiae]UVI35501.1 hypothetical protein L1F31_15460 [Brevibacterium spongiae]
MRVLFQGAGAISLAGAALFTDSHDVAVVSRTGKDEPRAAYPRRVSRLDPTDSNDSHGDCGAARRDPGLTPESTARTPGTSERPVNREWTVTRVAATRRVTITDWNSALEAGPWDLIILSTRPGDLDSATASAIREISPTYLAITSQVDGDLERAQTEFPDTEAVIFAPAFLSERLEPGTVPHGREVSYWAPLCAPRFLVAGRGGTVRSLVTGLGRLIVPVPLAAVLMPPAVFIPFVAELSIRGGDWAALKTHLERPSRAAAEAVQSRLGVRLPVFRRLARGVLEVLEAIVPIDITDYAGRHFARHSGQTLDMLAGWAATKRPTPVLDEQIASLNALR